MSIVLLCGALYSVMCAAMLCCIPVNRPANRLLAGLVGVLALYGAPYIIGYAGYYDAYPWLSFAPYKATLAIGPLLYLYLACLHAGGTRLPARWALHLAPALLQVLYYSVLFGQPLAFKNDWDASVHRPYLDPLETLALLASLALYWLLALRRHRQGGGHGEWPRKLLVATGLTILFWFLLTGAELACSGLNYFQRFPFYMWLAIVVGYLGTDGYRHGVVPFPIPAPAMAPAPAPAAPAVPDLAALGQRWRASGGAIPP
ncbi:hypothetical protein [Massilia sp. DWR3-1-1]|uniref:hypothetical protein n=1 Tax=Massilia sp. DWR3-1-1 TaxID=2804559 RepID=UPI003CEE0F94